MKTVVNLHWKHTPNIGDRVSAPGYLISPEIHRADLKEWRGYVDYDAVVFGGGMLFKEIERSRMLERILGLKIGWGVGHAQSVAGRLDYSSRGFVQLFDLLSVRDYGIGLRYVPCPSCMLPDFWTPPEPTRPVVVYTNPQALSLPTYGHPHMDNTLRQPAASFERFKLKGVIRFLSSAETVVSNSYHGIYWAMLLGRKVLAVPWRRTVGGFLRPNSKFYAFRYDVPRARPEDWPKHLHAARKFGCFLEECRELNANFAESVKALIYG